ncbi:MAG: hypothetical protein ACYC8T_02060 [Myxococcaceae bacterium]
MRVPWLLLAAACCLPGLAGAEEPAGKYSEATSRLASQRKELARAYRGAKGKKDKDQVLARARAEVLAALDRELLPAWYGTPWEFYGTTEVPRQGAIACGYFVSTVLRDAGFRVERVNLAKQASERIVKTFAPEADIQRFRLRPVEEVVAQVRARGGDGLYVVGLDFHVAFLRLEGPRAELCHSSWYPPQAVLCEPAVGAAGMRSDYHVVGPVLTVGTMRAWLEARELPTGQG